MAYEQPMATDLGFPPMSQASTPPNPSLFVDQSGSAIRVLVEASGIQNRPRLIRNLRNSGAHICHGPADAQIILVDAVTDAGRRFIRDWGADPNKVVLEYRWARKSIEAGRALLADEDWGGCITQDDGLPIGNEREMEEERPNPLPTPRPTPTEAGSSKEPRNRQASRKSSSSSEVPLQSQTYQPHFDQPSASTSNSFPSQSQLLQSLQPPMLQPSQPQMPQSQLPQLSQPQSPQSQMPQPPQSQALQPFHHHYHQLLPPPHSQYPIAQPSQSQPQADGMMSFPQQQMFMNNIGQQQHPNVQYNGQMSQMNLVATLFDVMRYNGINPMNFQGFNGQMPISPQSQFQQNPNMFSNSFGSNLNTTNGNDSVGPLELIPDSPSSPSSSSQVLPSSIRRRSQSPAPLPSHRSKGKKKVTPVGHKRKREPLLSPQKLPISSPSPSPSSSSHALDSSPSHLATQRPRVGSPREAGSVFKSPSGDSMFFFVQVDLKRRHDVVQALKKNCGKITTNISSADYVILSNNRSTTFSDLLKQTAAAGKQPIQPSFVHDCVEEEALLEWSDYVLEGLPVPKKRGRRPGTSQPKSKKQKTDSDKEKEEGKKQAKADKQKQKVMTKIQKEREFSSYVGPKSPTPPPLSSRIEFQDGKFAYTPEERQYAGMYARVLFERDPVMSNNSVAERLFEKLPHHALGSWKTFVSRTAREELDKIRKDVAIAKRKAAELELGSHPLAHVEEGDQRAEGSLSKRPRSEEPLPLETMPDVQPSADTNLEREDFEVICQFFASGGGDDSDDEAVWAGLAKHKPCKSAPTWPDFYQTRMDDINNHIEELVHANEVTAQLEAGDRTES